MKISANTMPISRSTKLFSWLLFGFGVLLAHFSYADVKSTKGNLIFDVQSDGIPEATLNSSGFSIGTNSGSSNLQVQGNALVTGSLMVGSSASASSSNLVVSGSIGFSTQTLNSSANLLESGSSTMVFADTSTQDITINLPYAGNVHGRTYTIKKISASNNLVITSSGNSIDGVSSMLFPASSNLSRITTFSDGREWFLLDSSLDSNTVASSNLVGWWQLDESSLGTVTDKSGRGNHGTHQNFSSANVGLSGHAGKCALFAQKNTPSLINLGSSIDCTGWTEMSITAWINPQGNPYESSILSSSNGVFNFACHNSDGDSLHSMRMYVKSSTFDTFYQGVSAQAISNVWSHVAVTVKSNNNFDLYVNGALKVTSVTGNNGTFLTPNITYMGNTNAAAGNSYGGYLDDVRIFNKKLSALEVYQIMGGKAP